MRRTPRARRGGERCAVNPASRRDQLDLHRLALRPESDGIGASFCGPAAAAVAVAVDWDVIYERYRPGRRHGCLSRPGLREPAELKIACAEEADCPYCTTLDACRILALMTLRREGELLKTLVGWWRSIELNALRDMGSRLERSRHVGGFECPPLYSPRSFQMVLAVCARLRSSIRRDVWPWLLHLFVAARGPVVAGWRWPARLVVPPGRVLAWCSCFPVDWWSGSTWAFVARSVARWVPSGSDQWNAWKGAIVTRAGDAAMRLLALPEAPQEVAIVCAGRGGTQVETEWVRKAVAAILLPNQGDFSHCGSVFHADAAVANTPVCSQSLRHLCEALLCSLAERSAEAFAEHMVGHLLPPPVADGVDARASFLLWLSNGPPRVDAPPWPSDVVPAPDVQAGELDECYRLLRLFLHKINQNRARRRAMELDVFGGASGVKQIVADYLALFSELPLSL
jgi:hypothetical protein